VARRLTPQDKKILSYQHDRRNSYGEAGARSRFAIRRRKQLVNKANRRAATQALHSSPPEVADLEVQGHQPKRWEKSPDKPLVEWLRNRRIPKGESLLGDEAVRRNRKSYGDLRD
jgi:hypothetical protein